MEVESQLLTVFFNFNTMEHKFNIEIAEKIGLEASIILNNLIFWVEHNRANNTNFNDGCYWTYNSIEAFKTLFPYLTKHKIIGALKLLEDNNLIITGNYNKSNYDRTKWYSVNQFHDLLKNGNGNIEKRTPIPDNKTDSNILLSEIKISDERSKEEYYKIAESFRQLFMYNSMKQGLTNLKDLEKAKYKTWTDTVRLMVESDKTSIERLREIRLFLDTDTEQATFWKKNIRSINKLRLKINQLVIAINTDKEQAKTTKKQSTLNL